MKPKPATPPETQKMTSSIKTGSMHDLIASLSILPELIPWYFQPGKRKDSKLILGELIGLAPFVVCYFPAIWFSVNITMQAFWAGVGLLVCLITFIDFTLVVYVKKKLLKAFAELDHIVELSSNARFVRALNNLLSPRKQLLIGALIALTILGMVCFQIPFRFHLTYFSLLVSIGYIGTIWGSSLYCMFTIPELLSALSHARFKITALYPHQQKELRQVSEIVTTISMAGSLYTTLFITIFITLQFIIAFRFEQPVQSYLLLGVIEASVLILALVIINIPFFSFHSFISQIIKRAKVEQLERLSEGMTGLLSKAEQGNAEVVDQIVKIQALMDQIDHSRNTVLASGTVSQFVTSLVVAVLPIVISAFLS